MTDLSKSIIAKSDQLNADDLINREITIKITEVGGRDGEQPIAVSYEGDGGKPWYPCKSMRRVLCALWGNDGKAYVGRSLTLYRDPKVKFGGIEVGGIRISHMTHLESPVTLALSASKANKKPFVVKPLVVAEQPSADDMIKAVEKAADMDALKAVFASATKLFKDSKDFAKIHEAKEKRKTELTPKE